MTTRRLPFFTGLLSIICGFALLAVRAENTHTGQWIIERCTDKLGTLQLTLRYSERGDNERNDSWGRWGGWDSTQSHSIDLADLTGLTDADLKSAGTHVKFKIIHDAGTLENDGWFANGKGSGHFDYIPNSQFVSE